MTITTTDLLAKVRRRAGLPPSGGWTDADLLDFATSELRRKLAPWLAALREEYGLLYRDDSVGVGVATIRIAPAALGDGPREVRWIRSDGSFKHLTRLTLEQSTPVSQPIQNYADPVWYTVEGEYLRLTPPCNTAGTLRQYFIRRPPALVLPSACARITALVDSNTVTVSATVPSTFTAGTLVDIVRGNSPYDAHTLSATLTNATTGTTVDFAVPYPSSVAVGDYVSLAGEACVAPLTDELCEVLVTATCAAAQEALSNQNQATRFRAAVEADLASLTSSHSPRVPGSLVRITPLRGLFGNL